MKNKKETNCEHKNIDFFDGIQEGYNVKFYFCLDCNEEIESYFYSVEDDQEIDY